MIILETIHHGDYFSERVSGPPADAALSARQILATMGETSPYPFVFNPIANRYHAEALAEFERTGACSIGWARYERLDG